MAAGRRERKLVLSPTKIVSWLECNLQYKFTYIDRLSRFYYKPNRYDTFGSVMHRTLQMFHEAGGAESVAPEQLADTLESCWVSAGYGSPDEEREQKEIGRQILQQHWQESVKRPSRVLLLEKQLRHDYGHFALMGRLDRVDEHTDGTLEVIDYKSSREEISEQEVRESCAMACYSLLLHKHYPGRRVLASIVALAAGRSATVELSRDELDVVEEEAHNAASQITGREEFLPNYGPHCEGCIYNAICYRKGPVEWEAKREAFEREMDGSW